MKTISIVNLKGGVGKTITAINMAYLLSNRGYRTLLIDNDKQGNTSKFFGAHSYDKPSLADVLIQRDFPVEKAIAPTGYENLDILPGNMNLLRADKEILMDCLHPQQIRLKKALEPVADRYDYIVIDNAPDLDMGVINALTMTNDVIIPIKLDQFALDGIELLTDQIHEIQTFNTGLRVAGCLVTMSARSNVNSAAEEYLRTQTSLPVFDTVIRKTVKVDESTFIGQPLQIYSAGCTAAKDYAALVEEYLRK